MNAVCIAPYEIRDGDLLAYLEGAATPGVAAHLARCAFCTAEVAGLARMDATLVAAYVRAACPAPDDLLMYQAGLLSRPAQRRVKQHLATCTACQADLARLALPVTASVQTPLVERLRQARAVIMATLQPPLFQPALALRGQEKRLRLFSAPPYQVLLNVIPPAYSGEAGRGSSWSSLAGWRGRFSCLRARLGRAVSAVPVGCGGLVWYAVWRWHYPIARLVRELFVPGVTFLIVAALSIAMAALSYEFLEKPLRARRLRYGEGPRR